MTSNTGLRLVALFTLASLVGACQPEKEGATQSTGDSTGDSTGEVGSSDDGGVTEATTGEAPLLEEGFAATLTSQGGCADVFIYAQNPGATVSVELRMSDLVKPVVESGVAATTELTLPDAAAQLVVNLGHDLHEDLCTDFVEVEPTIDHFYEAVAGKLSVTVTPGEEGDSPTATVTLEDVTWKLTGEDTSPTVDMPTLTISDVVVGWFPG